MSTAISCHAMDIGVLHIPSFQLSLGDIMCLRWPVGETHPDYLAFLDILKGTKMSERIMVNRKLCVVQHTTIFWRLFGSTMLADTLLPRIPRRFLPSFQKKRVLSYYILQDGMQKYIDNDTETLLRQIVRTDRHPLVGLSMNEKKSFAFYQCASQNDIVVFSSSGCDFSFYPMIEKYAEGRTLIQCQFPVLSHQLPPFHDAPVINIGIKQQV